MTVNTEKVAAAEQVTFESLGLAPEILKALSEFGYTTPTPI